MWIINYLLLGLSITFMLEAWVFEDEDVNHLVEDSAGEFFFRVGTTLWVSMAWPFVLIAVMVGAIKGALEARKEMKECK